MTPEQIAARNVLIAELMQKYGTRRVDLYRSDYVIEEVWGVCVDAGSAHIYASTTSKNERITMRILNVPEKFCGLEWGDLLIARSAGPHRPYAIERDNVPVDDNDYGMAGY